MTDKTQELLDVTSKWIIGMVEYPGYKEFRGKSLVMLMRHAEDEDIQGIDELQDFIFPEPLESQRCAILAFYALVTTQQAVEDTQYYLGRFPFAHAPISKPTYLRYTIEMYLSRLYEFRERMKKCLNAMNALTDERSMPVGALVRHFDKSFGRELRERNLVQHHQSFEELGLESIAMVDLIARTDEREGRDRGWGKVADAKYRKDRAWWVEHVKARAARLKEYQDHLAGLILDKCAWIHEDPLSKA